MVTEMITLKLENKFLWEIDSLVQKNGYQNRTEFIRNALRQKVEEAKLKETLVKIANLRGKAKKRVSEEEYEQIRKSLTL